MIPVSHAHALMDAFQRLLKYWQDNFAHPEVFDGFRFSRMRQQYGHGHDKNGEGSSIFNRHMVSTAQEHLVFGHGRHACPGRYVDCLSVTFILCMSNIGKWDRFFAATELKAMLAHILINYDVKAETEGVRPPDECLGLLRVPSREGKIWIKQRQ